MALYVDIEPGDTLVVTEGTARITLQRKSGQRAKLRVDSDKPVSIQKAQDQVLNILKRPPLPIPRPA